MHPALRALALILAALLLATPALAQDEKKKKKRSVNFTVGQVAYKKLTEVQELMAEDQFVEAAKVLDDLAKKRLNDHEKALTLQTRGYIYANQDNYAAATKSFEECLALEALPPGAQQGTRYNVAQLYLMQERFAESVKALERWFAEAENPGASAYYVLATAYALDERYDKALAPAQKAVALTDSPKEQWLQLLMTLYFQKKDMAKLAGVLEQLVSRFPKKSYWMQLSAVYAELGRDEKSLAVLQLAYEQGLLVEDTELRRLAQLYLYHQLPYRAALVMSKGLESKQIESDEDAWEILGNAWMQAREYDRSIPPLERAAALSEDGELYMRLGQMHMEKQNWAKAEEALSKALRGPKLENRGKTYVLLGVSRFSADRLGPAEQAFAKAREYESSREAANQWLTHIERKRASATN